MNTSRRLRARCDLWNEECILRYIASCSFGKDSLATVILAKQNSEPIDEVMYCEVMFDEGVSGEIPEHREFIHTVAIPKLESWGIKTTVLQSSKTYVGQFQHVITRSGVAGRNGKIRSFPLCARCWVNRDLKMPPIKAWAKEQGGDVTQYLGIASDEQDRLARLDGVTKVSLLDKNQVCEARAFEICRPEGLISPMYEFTNRGGCFFCPNAKEKELRHLYDHHPELWSKMLWLQSLPNKATEKFNRTMMFSDYDDMFRLEDAQISLFQEHEVAHQYQPQTHVPIEGDCPVWASEVAPYPIAVTRE